MAEQKTNEEIYAKLKEKVASSGADSFRVKIFRRNAVTQNYPIHTATFENVQMDYLGTIETWIPELCGGGPYFMLEIFHSSDNLTPLGRLNFMIEGEARKVNPALVSGVNWKGPRQMSFPVIPSADVQFLGAYQTSPAGPPVGGPHNSPAMGTMPGAVVPPPQTEDPRVSAAIARLEATQKEVEAFKHKSELEATERRGAERIRALEDKLNAQQSAPPREDPISRLVAAFAPIVQQMLSSSAEMRVLTMQQNSALAEKQMVMQANIAQQNQEMIKLAFAPRPIDPATQMMIDSFKTKKDEAPQHEMVAAMADSFSKMTRTTMQLVHSAAQMNNGGEEPPAMMIMREATKALQTIVEGIKTTYIPKVRRPLAEAPAPAPAALPATATTNPTTNGAPPGAVQKKVALTFLDKLEERVRNLENPVEVATQFISKLGTQDIEPELMRHGGDVVALFRARLGDTWLNEHPSHETYARHLMEEIQKQFAEMKANGSITPEEEPDEDGEGAAA